LVAFYDLRPGNAADPVLTALDPTLGYVIAGYLQLLKIWNLKYLLQILGI